MWGEGSRAKWMTKARSAKWVVDQFPSHTPWSKLTQVSVLLSVPPLMWWCFCVSQAVLESSSKEVRHDFCAIAGCAMQSYCIFNGDACELLTHTHTCTVCTRPSTVLPWSKQRCMVAWCGFACETKLDFSMIFCFVNTLAHNCVIHGSWRLLYIYLLTHPHAHSFSLYTHPLVYPLGWH